LATTTAAATSTPTARRQNLAVDSPHAGHHDHRRARPLGEQPGTHAGRRPNSYRRACSTKALRVPAPQACTRLSSRCPLAAVTPESTTVRGAVACRRRRGTAFDEGRSNNCPSPTAYRSVVQVVANRGA